MHNIPVVIIADSLEEARNIYGCEPEIKWSIDKIKQTEPDEICPVNKSQVILAVENPIIINLEN
uniref:Uncharacterized protein n=1 Tax=Marseillevirus LCMAC201 TaxID=2506605 RepID=A0A481YW77_9VIRU|nr:MAG: hypothetical protein LCMAC201_01820 [Marseillevirus LCMAC201]